MDLGLSHNERIAYAENILRTYAHAGLLRALRTRCEQCPQAIDNRQDRKIPDNSDARAIESGPLGSRFVVGRGPRPVLTAKNRFAALKRLKFARQVGRQAD